MRKALGGFWVYMWPNSEGLCAYYRPRYAFVIDLHPVLAMLPLLLIICISLGLALTFEGRMIEKFFCNLELSHLVSVNMCLW